MFLLTVECQLVNVEGVEKEHHHLATNSALVGLGMIHQWMIKLEGGGLMKYRMLTRS